MAKFKETTGMLTYDITADGGLVVSTGVGRFELCAGGPGVLGGARNEHGESWLGGAGVRLVVSDGAGRKRPVIVERMEPLPCGTTVKISGILGRGTGLLFFGRLSFCAGTGFVRVEITAHNPRRARHAGGYWDLGDPGSVLVQELAIEVDVGGAEIHGTPQRAFPTGIMWQERPGQETKQAGGGGLEIYQESSGGENWQSRNHVNRRGQVPLAMRGYRVRAAGGETCGERASPTVCVASGERFVACAVEEFWEKFPTAIEVEENRLRISFWPRQFGDLHELQAGEQCTRVVWLNFGANDPQPCQSLDRVFDAPAPAVDLAGLAGSGALWHVPDADACDRIEMQELLREALAGERSLFAKREAIDEYGWRNFGDMWADHEEAYCEDARPVISHYNNQYDLLHGLLVQYVASGEPRWWQLADPLARHILDIDVYHTTRDKPAYNSGLFWHTAHYHSAGRGTHRSMSTDMLGKKVPAPGAGPCNEHNYSTGLLLYYHLTGNERARETVIGLADWVIAMDDGRRHVLGVASSSPTGDASRTTVPDFHGPGRGAGNSVNALLNGWLLSGESRYLEKIRELIYRTIHPQDDLAARDLGNAEMRWSYTVYLQALARFIDLTAQEESLAETRAYATASLLHYARWMADHERFYLDEPEKLEYPTETWAAQELRKGTTLWLAARLTGGAEAERFRVRGREILDRAWGSLMSFETRGCTRPVALVLQQGYLETALEFEMEVESGRNKDAPECDARATAGFGPALRFVHQKQALKRAIRSPRAWPVVLASALRPARWANALRQTWFAERCRRAFE